MVYMEYGIFLALLYPQAAAWAKLESGFGATNYGPLSWILSIFALGVSASGIRDVMASGRPAK